AVPVAHATPIVELGGDLHGKRRPGVDPDDLMILVGPAANVDAVGFQADEARNRQTAGGARRKRVGAGPGGREQDEKRERDAFSQAHRPDFRLPPQIRPRARAPQARSAATRDGAAALSWPGHLIDRNRPNDGRRTSATVSVGSVKEP